MSKKDEKITDALRRFAQPLTGAARDYDSLMRLVGDRRFVLIGEASHGTHEFYATRAAITKRLIVERGFTTVAVEADFPDALRVDDYTRGRAEENNLRAADDAANALEVFTRFPEWMWRNADVRDFVAWLRAHNEGLAEEDRISFYGIDLYSLHASIDAVLEYLNRVDPEAAQRARARYSCFEHFEDSQAYGYAASRGHTKPCEEEVVKQLVELNARAREYASRDGRRALEDFFHAEQNARLVQNAEEYYRSMFHGRVSSWNLRDRHMADTLDALVQFADYQNRRAKIVVWAHNSHLGDARATEMGERHGEWNVGQLVREAYGEEDTLLVGFSTYTGTVTAASNWGDAPLQKRVRPGLAGSYEGLFHETGIDRFILFPHEHEELIEALREPRLQRAIGVIYRPETERASHYFHTRLSEQFDVMIHFDETRHVEPLAPAHATGERTETEEGEMPDTFPSGM